MQCLEIPHLKLDMVANSGQCFRMKALDADTYRVLAGKKQVDITPLGDGRFQLSCEERETDGWRRYFDIETDYGPLLTELPAGDDFLHRAASCCDGLRILRQEPFETLISFICSQRKSIPAIRDCVERLCEHFGEKLSEDIYAFPTPEQLARAAESELRACALGYRAPYVLGTARLVASGALDLTACSSLSDEALQQALMDCPGVGVKVASCVMLFAYHRFSIAPVDVWIQKVIDEEYGGMSPFPAWGARAGWYQQMLFYYRQHLIGRQKA